MKNEYTRESGYDLSDDFIDSMSSMDVRTGIKISAFISSKIEEIPVSQLISTVLGGVVIDDDNDPITFAVEIINNDSEFIILSDLTFIPMDDYLDLAYLNKNTK